MAKRVRSSVPSGSQTAFQELTERLLTLLSGEGRCEIVEHCMQRRGGAGSASAVEALARLRAEFVRDSLPGPHGGRALGDLVRVLERETQADGFHVLRDWDGRARRFVDEPVSVAMLNFAERMHGAASRDPAAARAALEAGIAGPDLPRTLALLVDHFVLFVIALLVMRAWDDEGGEARLEAIERLLTALQGPGGSEHRFVAGPESLMWIAISNYHPDDDAYNRLLAKVRGLDAAWQLRFAGNGAHILGTHLRWGLEAYYKRDFELLRRDNVADYPWLLFSVATVMKAYEQAAPEDRDPLALALLNGLTADPPGFTFEVPPALEPHREERGVFVERFAAHRAELQECFQRFRPDEQRYSPIAFHFNFPHNAMKAAFAMRLAGIPAPNLALDALFEPANPAAGALAEALTTYSRANPETIRDRQVMVMAYNVTAGSRMWRAAMLAEPRRAGPP